MLIHGVTFTAELNWAKVFAPLARHFRVVAADLRGHGDGIRAGSRFRLEDCADDIAALAGVLGIGGFTAVGYSMGGMVAQLLYRRHAALVSGLVLCSTARDVRGSPAEQMAALAAPTMAAALQWNPLLHFMTTEVFGEVLLGRLDDPATGRWARAQLSRTTLATAVSAIRAVCEFTSASWISQVDVPPRWWSPPGTRSCRRAASLSWPGRCRAHRCTRWTPVTGHASPRRSCSPLPCSRHAGRWRQAATVCCARPPNPAGPRSGRALEPPGSRAAGTRCCGRSGYTRCRTPAHGRERPRSAAPDDATAERASSL